MFIFRTMHDAEIIAVKNKKHIRFIKWILITKQVLLLSYSAFVNNNKYRTEVRSRYRID